MKHISRNNINLGLLIGVLLAISFVSGIYYRIMLLFAGLFLLTYIIFVRKYLRCPNCEGLENLDRLLYAKNHVYHCRHCGKRIVVH